LQGEERRAADNRLDRIENKLDKLTDYIVNIGRLDERVRVLESNYKSCSARVANNESVLKDTTIIVKAFTKAFWLLVSAVVIASVSLYIKG